MFNPDRDEDTICAVATPSGFGGISVIRVSGREAWSSVKYLAKDLSKDVAAKIQSHTVHLATITDFYGEELDEVLITYFQEGRSYTGEETVEISCHGSPAITRSILKALISMGCRAADRGEFTYRSFMNGRMDLVQAESVLGLIESTSDLSRRVALRQLKGGLTQTLEKIEDDLTWCLANLEATIDFSTEDIDVSQPEELSTRLNRTLITAEKLLGTYEQGRVLREGYRVAILGAPNAGKSSLLNALLDEDRAIVSEFAGTTRDLVEGQLIVGGIPITFVDTAGLREASDPVEKIGIKKTYEAAETADFVIVVVDLADSERSLAISSRLLGKRSRLLVVGNKIDLIKQSSEVDERLASAVDLIDGTNPNEVLVLPPILVSSVTGEGIEKVIEAIAKSVQGNYSEESVVLSQARQFEGLGRLIESVKRGLGAIASNPSPEFVAADLHLALLSAQELLGKRFDDQIMDRVFKEFCIGK